MDQFDMKLFMLVFLMFHSGTFGAFDSFMLSHQWPSGFCSSTSPSRISNPCQTKYVHGVKDFSIHGLWPHNFTGAQPEFCTGTGITSTLPQPIPSELKTDLESTWPNLLKKSDLTFWQDEWTKHGTCTTFQEKPWNYFALGLEIHKRIKLDATLKAANIVPDDKKYYKMEDFNSTIFASLRAYPELMCEGRGGRKGGLFYLIEIRICLDESGANYKNCTNSPQSCGQGKRKEIVLKV